MIELGKILAGPISAIPSFRQQLTRRAVEKDRFRSSSVGSGNLPKPSSFDSDGWTWPSGTVSPRIDVR